MTPERIQSDVDRLTEGIRSYLATRNTPWTNPEEMREAVNTTVQIIFYDALDETKRIVAGLGQEESG